MHDLAQIRIIILKLEDVTTEDMAGLVSGRFIPCEFNYVIWIVHKYHCQQVEMKVSQ